MRSSLLWSVEGKITFPSGSWEERARLVVAPDFPAAIALASAALLCGYGAADLTVEVTSITRREQVLMGEGGVYG